MNEKSHNVIISVRKRPLSLVEKTKEHDIITVNSNYGLTVNEIKSKYSQTIHFDDKLICLILNK